ncbi:MAG: type VI secretion system tip protein VgrG, partial [Myxococcales bacterium]|nr:type VI secretion system tip protein VgrG [Myxococcales bacterium]
GVVMRVWYLGTFHERLHLRLEVGPALARLGLGQRSRVFQGLTTVEIVQRVTAEALAPLGRTVDASRLRRGYEALDYCVQFRESDLDFVSRILAREGIGFVFEHGEAAETMVLLDDPHALRGAVLLGDDEDDDQPPPVVAVSTSQADRMGTESIVQLEWRRRVHARRVEAAAWDFRPWEPARTAGWCGAEASDPTAFGEHYEHDERRLVERGRTHVDHTPRAAEDAHAHLVAASRAALGHGDVLGFAPGRTFEVEGHPHAALDRTYALLRVVHRADCPEADADDHGGFAGPNYENRFECIPAELPWRPRPRPRPRVHGHLLATVVGPAGEEIHTDEHGRIKVWIHWDREHGPRDPEASCWLRVAQPWAGPGWGTMFIPRVGTEVLVSFVDGDPDQPLCVGCVYDGHNLPPHVLPEQRTRTAIRTCSTPGGQGFNELRFEDAAGREEIFVHAERDLRAEVGHDHRRRVGHRESIEVGEDRRVSVGGSEAVAVEGSHRLTVRGRSAAGGPLPAPHHAIDVEGDSSLSARGSIVLQAEQSITLRVQSTTLTLTAGGIVLQAGPGASASLDASVELCSGPGRVQLDPSGGLAVAATVSGGPPTPAPPRGSPTPTPSH